MTLMASLTPLFLLCLSILCWIWSHKTHDRLVAWCRFLLAGFFLFLASIYAVIGVLQWVMA